MAVGQTTTRRRSGAGGQEGAEGSSGVLLCEMVDKRRGIKQRTLKEVRMQIGVARDVPLGYYYLYHGINR